MWLRRLKQRGLIYLGAHWYFIVPAAVGLTIAWALPPFPLFEDRAAGLLQSHLIEELFSIIVSILIAVIAWHDYQLTRSTRSGILFSGFIGVAIIDLAHTLTYDGMPRFIIETSTQRAIFFWLAGRTCAAITLLLYALNPKFKLSSFVYLAIGLWLSGTVFWLGTWRLAWIPLFFEKGVGTTALKSYVEYGLVSANLAIAGIFIVKSDADNQSTNFKFATSCLIMGMGELVFSNYKAPSDFLNNFGHVFKIVSYGFLYNSMFVTAIRAPYQRIEEMAYHDPLTGLPNRILVEDRFERAKGQALRNGSQVALFFLDLDNFKAFNDTKGHSFGDKILQIVTRQLKQGIRDADTLSRIGGDEFILIVTDLKQETEIIAVTTKIMALLNQPFSVEGDQYEVSASIGVSLFPKDGTTLDELRKHADRAMYQAKDAGKNTYLFFDRSMNRNVENNLLFRNSLKQALENQEFELYFQPQVDLRNRRIIGAEALIRWNHPQQGLLAPGCFIPAAEASGLIIPIGEWVLNAACREAKRWQSEGFSDLTVAVNCSGVQFKRGGIEKSIAAALDRTGLNPSMLEIELTESILIQNIEQVIQTLKTLKDLGVKMSIDDFGTGYSSLSYLRRFEVDKLKIDQTFVRALLDAPDDDSIVKAIIEMAKSLGLSAIAEGIETAAVAEKLLSLGCNEGQGYYYGRPMNAQAFRETLSQPVHTL